MEAIIKASLKLQFSTELVQYQSLIILTLVIYWIAARWNALRERYSPQNMGLGLFAVIFGFGTFAAVVFAVDWGTEYLLLAITLGLGIALALSDTAISICFFLALLFLRPWEIMTEPNDHFALLPKLTMAFCIGNALLRWAKTRAFNFKWNRTATALVGFATWAFITTFKGGNMAENQALFFDNFFKCVFLFLLILNALDSREEINLIIWTIVITMFGVGVASIYRTSLLAQALEGIAVLKVRLSGFGAFENSNDIAALMVMILPFSLMPLIRKNIAIPVKIFCLSMVGIIIECIRLSQSRGALMGVVAIIGIMILSTMKNRKMAIILAALGVAGVLAVASVSSRSEADLAESKEIRMVYIQTGLMMGVKNPVFGVGFNSYANRFFEYATGAVDGAEHRTAHNSWVLAFGETGFLGFLLFASVYFTSLYNAFQFRKEKAEFFLAIVGYGIAMTFLSHTYFIYPYVLYALSGVASRLYGRPEPEKNTLASATLLPEPQSN